jgi:hypothetical protein
MALKLHFPPPAMANLKGGDKITFTWVLANRKNPAR